MEEVIQVREAAPTTLRIESPSIVAEWSDALDPPLKIRAQEHMYSLNLDSKYRVISWQLVAKGGLNSTVVHPREIFRAAIIANAAAVILVHNHPSGDPEASLADIRITNRVAEAGKLVGIELLDHMIIGEEGNFSMKEAGII